MYVCAHVPWYTHGGRGPRTGFFSLLLPYACQALKSVQSGLMTSIGSHAAGSFLKKC